MPVVAFISAASASGASGDAIAFGQGLKESGYHEGQNVTSSTIGLTDDMTACQRCSPTSFGVRSA